jgi:hypothetical protein
MRGSTAAKLLVFAVTAALLLGAPGCKGKRKKQTGTLKEWIVGSWVRNDDLTVWSFNADGEMITSGQLPIGGSYGTLEPDKVKVTISGAGAVTAGMMLGLPVDESKTLIIIFTVKDDEMRPANVKSDVVFQKD